jgi:heme exporter protein A
MGSSVGEIRTLRLVGVHYQVGGTVVLRGVDGEMRAGRLQVVVGSNGSGKTTLLRVIALLLRPSLGHVLHLPNGGPTTVRQGLGLVSHESMAYLDLTGLQNLQLAASLFGRAASSQLGDLVERFRLGAFLGRPLRVLSRGQRQRVALVRSLVHGPSLVLLDEPTAGLDREGVRLLVAFVREEVELGRLVLVVTHEPRVFGPLDPLVWRLDGGRWAAGSGGR